MKLECKNCEATIHFNENKKIWYHYYGSRDCGIGPDWEYIYAEPIESTFIEALKAL